MKKLFLLLTILAWACSASADIEKKGMPEIPRKNRYKLSICAIFRNEAPYLKEWIEYHRLIGVDHFYLYDVGSIDAFRKILNPYIKNNVVTLVPWKGFISLEEDGNEALWVIATQLSAYENAAKWKAIRHTKWLVFLDIDEFLVPCSDKKLVDILEEYEKYPGVTLSIEYYNASAKGSLPPRKLVIESTEITAPPKPTLVKEVEKTIFKPELTASITWPPFHYFYTDGSEALNLDKAILRINSYENRLRFQKLDRVKRKANLEQEKISPVAKKEILELGYEIEDTEKPIYRYVPDLYKKMGLSIGDK